jgi:sugar O-acyltransferase (sialic acid O-acetyltransferase NeuD family)
MKEIIIIGSGAVAAEVLMFIDDMNRASKEKIEIRGLIDDNLENYETNSERYGFHHRYLGTTDSYEFSATDFFVLGLANIEARGRILKKVKGKGPAFVNIVHPSAQISRSAKIGIGNIIYPNCVIGPACRLGDHNLLTSFSFISHDSIIGDNNFFATAGLSGNVEVGDNNFFGIRSVILPSIHIGSDNILQAGMVVDKNVKDHETVFYRYKEKVSIITR